jgi:hypothetical protein
MRANLAVCWLSLMVGAAFACAADGGIAPLRVPLQVFEAVHVDARGMDRTEGPVSVGVPLPDLLAVKESDGRPALALQGAEAWQFRTLAKWPSGNVRWAQVCFPADCKANADNRSFVVTVGNGASAQRPLGRQDADKITVDTGPLQVTLRRKGFNLFDQVTVDGTQIVAPGSPGALLVGRATKVKSRRTQEQIDAGLEGSFLASAEPNTALRIEQNGPARCVVHVKGSFRDARRRRYFGYFARCFFYRGKRSVKVSYTLTHDSADDLLTTAYEPFRSMVLKTQLAGDGPVTVRVGTDKAPLAVKPARDAAVTFRQYWPWRGFQMTGTTQWYLGLPPDTRRDPQLNGFVITEGERELRRGPAEASPDLAWLDCARAGGAGVTVGIRFAAGNFPKTLAADAAGRVTVGLFPGENTNWGLGRGSHNTHEVLYHFHAGELKDPAGVMFRFQYPLVARAPVAWYNRNVRRGEIYPLHHFVSRSEEQQQAAKHKWPQKHTRRCPRMLVWRGWYWGEGGFRNQHDFARIAFMNFLRENVRLDRAGEYYLWAEDRFGYNADWSVRHGRIGGFGGKITFEFEHRHWYGMPVFYFCTGDQRIGDAAFEYIEGIFDELKDHRSFFGWPRVFGWNMYSLGAGYDLTGDSKYLQAIRARIRQAASGKTGLRLDPLRGVYAFLKEDWRTARKNLTIKPALMFGYIQHDGMYNALWQLPWDDPDGERLAGWLEGMEWLMAREAYFYGKDKFGHDKAYTLYRYSVNQHPAGSSRNTWFMVGESFCSILLPQLRFGRPFRPGLLEKMVASSHHQVIVEYQFTFLDHPSCQASIHWMLHGKPGAEPPAAVNDLRAEALGEGKVRLTWTTPPATTRFRVRYADRPMVENLHYDPASGKFQFDPKQFANWWAAQNVQGEPAAQSGSVQRFIAEGVAPGTAVFAIRGWSADGVRSRISNQATVDVR